MIPWTEPTETETYEEWTRKGNSIENEAGAPLAVLVLEWFFDYRIGWEDEKKFGRYLKRNILTLRPQYEEMLRNQPGLKVKLDWFVTEYEEAQRKTHDTGNTSDGGSKTVTTTPGIETVTRKPDLYKYDTDTVEQKYLALKDTDEWEGAETHTRTGGHQEETVAGKRKTTDKPKVSVKVQNDGGESSWHGHSEIQANLPMSKSYANFTQPDANDSGKQYYEKAKKGMPTNLEWKTASAQAQTFDNNYTDNDGSQITSYIYKDGVEGNITETEGDAKNPDKSHFFYDKDGEQERIEYDKRKNTHTKDGSVTETAPHEHGTDITTTTRDLTTVVDTGNSSTDTTNDGQTREIRTGRHEDAATLLMKAKDCIASTNAWLWMREQLEPLFLTNMED